jgi:hypothetical protein
MSGSNIKSLGQNLLSKNFENDSYTKNLPNQNLRCKISKNNENFTNIAHQKKRKINDENLQMNLPPHLQHPSAPAPAPTLQLLHNRTQKRFNEIPNLTKKE